MSSAVASSGGDAAVEDAAVEDAAVEAETALFEAFTAVPSMAGAVLSRGGGGGGGGGHLTLHVTTTQRDLAANRNRASRASIPVPTAPPPAAGAPPQLHHPPFGAEERGVVLASISPSGDRRLVVGPARCRSPRHRWRWMTWRATCLAELLATP